MSAPLSMTQAERELLASALGCEFHGPDYGECSGCAPHAEQVWDEAVEQIVAGRVDKALTEVEGLLIHGAGDGEVNTCGWCGEELIRSAGFTGAPAYHRECAEQVYGDKFQAEVAS